MPGLAVPMTGPNDVAGARRSVQLLNAVAPQEASDFVSQAI
jgi:hypothetical protein